MQWTIVTQATRAIPSNYDYNGKQYQSSLTAERMLWRNRLIKLQSEWNYGHAKYKYIDDAEIECMRRSAGWEASAPPVLPQPLAASAASCLRRNGMRQSMPAHRKKTGGDVLRSIVWKSLLPVWTQPPHCFGQTAVFSAQPPFKLNGTKRRWLLWINCQSAAAARRSWFDAEQSLFGEQGFYWQIL